VATAGQAFSLAGKHLKGGAHLLTGLRWVDHRINRAALGGDVRVEQPFLVGRFKLGPLLGAPLPVQNLNRPFGPHHSNFRRRPGQSDVVAHGLGVHDDIGAAVGLAGGDVDPADRGPGVSESQVCPVADHSPPFEILPRVEP